MQLLLASDFAVDCSENEILRVVLEWIGKSDEREKIDCLKILRYINFKEILVNDIEKILKALDIKRQDELYNAVWNFAVPQSLHIENEYKLLNNRGMALALVKVGGFELSGLTNEITYSFPSSGNPRSIEGPWRFLTEVPHVKQGAFGVAVLNNCIFVIGGSYDISLDSEDVHPFGFRYDPLASEWSTLKPMNFDRCRFSLNRLGESLIAVGGFSEGIFDRLEDQAVASVEKYDMLRDEWTLLKPMPGAYRSRHAGVSFKNKLFISGGIDQYGNVMDSFYEYDLTTDMWEKKLNIAPRADHVMVRVDKNIYFCGGWEELDGQRRLLTAIECFNIEDSTIRTVTHIPTPRFHPGIAIISHKIYFVGGFAADGK